MSEVRYVLVTNENDEEIGIFDNLENVTYKKFEHIVQLLNHPEASITKHISYNMERLSKQQQGLQALYENMAEQVNDMHDVMFHKRKNNAEVLSVFKYHFGTDSIFKKGNNIMQIDTNILTFNLDVINTSLGKKGFRCELMESSRPNNRYRNRYKFRIKRW